MDSKLLEGPVQEVAARLLGSELIREINGQIVRVKIVETEAYHQSDAASHSYKGRTPRTEIMFGPAGFLYVYFMYGMHYCCNVVTGPEGEGSAVLLRAVEPLEGEEIMRHNRHAIEGHNVSNGPAKLCQALQIDKAQNGHDLRLPPLQLILGSPVEAMSIVQTTRVGISRAKDVPWRFYIKNNPYVSKM